jgi:S-DNA-T family DNA segregation ATPase FtsK/SpoIIIE
VEIAELDFGTVAEWEEPDTGQDLVEVADPGPNDIARCVNTACAAADAAGIRPPRKPWREPLAPSYDLEKLNEYRDDQHFLLGVLDEPENQRQAVVYYEPDRDGNMAVLGTGGAGKSTALRTIAISAAFSTRHGGPVHVYCLDFAAGGLRMLEDLPHVGAVIAGDDEERVMRLLRMLRDVVDDRAVKFARANASTITEYRSLADAPAEPRILLLVDGMSAFREEYEYGRRGAWFTTFAQIAADGRQLGVHVVVTGDRANSISPSIASTIQRRVVMRMAAEDDYVMLGVPKDILEASSPPGRGIVEAKELQFAILGEDANVASQARRIRGIAATAARRGETTAPPVLRLPETVMLEDLPVCDGRGWPVIGIDDETLGPIGIEPRGTLLVSGPPGAGRTTALATIGASLRRAMPDLRILLMTPRRSVLEGQSSWDLVVQGESQVAEIAKQMTERLCAEETGSGELAVLIDSMTDFTGTSAESPLEALIKAMVRAEQFLVAESESSTWSQAWTLSKPMKAGRKALLLVPSESEGDSLAGASLPRIRNADFGPGRGFLAIGGKARKLQVAVTR